MVIRAVFVELLDQQRAVQFLRVNPYPHHLLPHRELRETAAEDQQH